MFGDQDEHDPHPARIDGQCSVCGRDVLWAREIQPGFHRCPECVLSPEHRDRVVLEWIWDTTDAPRVVLDDEIQIRGVVRRWDDPDVDDVLSALPSRDLMIRDGDTLILYRDGNTQRVGIGDTPRVDDHRMDAPDLPDPFLDCDEPVTRETVSHVRAHEMFRHHNRYDVGWVPHECPVCGLSTIRTEFVRHETENGVVLGHRGCGSLIGRPNPLWFDESPDLPNPDIDLPSLDDI